MPRVVISMSPREKALGSPNLLFVVAPHVAGESDFDHFVKPN